MCNQERKVQCSYCKNKFFKNELIQETKTKRICNVCKAKKIQDAKDYKELIDFICKGFRISKPTGHQLKSIKKFRELGYTCKEIQCVLYYIFVVEKKKVEGTSIELVPYYYEKAKKHFMLIENARRSVVKTKIEPIVIKTGKPKTPNLRNTRLFMFEDIS